MAPAQGAGDHGDSYDEEYIHQFQPKLKGKGQ